MKENNMFMPSVIETIGRSTKAFDLPTKLLQDRIIYLGSVIDDDVANSIIMQMLWLQSDKPEEPISLYINSPGGSVYDGLAIKDTIDNISCKVNTLGVGFCASMGAYLLFAGSGERRATRNCRIMIHSVSSGMGGTIHDMKIDYEESHYLQTKIMNDIVVFSKGKLSKETLELKAQRDWYIDQNEAFSLGLLDREYK
jgi:ATP-dependent Clp protease protease subunit